MNNIFIELKHGTKEAHTALEATYPFNTMMKTEIFDRQAYSKNITVLASFHHYVYELLKKFNGCVSFTQYMQAEDVILAVDSDLHALLSNPQYCDFPAVIDVQEPEAMLAAAYVWMGSSMGARILYRWLNHAGFESLPMNYYETMIGLGKQWELFVRDGQVWADVHRVNPKKCITSANQLFEGLRLCAQSLTHQQRHPA